MTTTAPTSISAAQPALDETQVASAVRAAAQATGVSFEYLLAQANQESGLDPHAVNRHSSASGLFQFTANTWLDMVKRHGAEHGLSQYADAIKRGHSGKLYVADPQMRRAVLELRRDPTTSAIMAAEYAKENKHMLEHRLGRAVSSSDLYLAHFLGAAGAAKVLERMAATKHDSEDGQPDAAAEVLPDAARSNPEFFVEPVSSEPRSVASLYRSVQASFRSALNDVADVATRADLAALRPEPRPLAATPAVASADATGEAKPAETPFANAIEPPSPFFPVPMPPPLAKAATHGQSQKLTLRDFDAEPPASPET